MSNFWAMVCTLAGCAGFWGFAQFMISRHDKKIEKQLLKIEKDECRTQLQLLIFNRPDHVAEIMTLAQHYFEDLKANWYMTTIFNEWLDEQHLSIPSWLPRKNGGRE